MHTTGELYVIATALPLIAFGVLLLGGKRLGRSAAYLSVAAILGSFLLSAVGLYRYAQEGHLWANGFHATHNTPSATPRSGHGSEHPAATPERQPEAAAHRAEPSGLAWSGNFRWVQFGSDIIRLGYHVDNLTVLMFFMVTLVASLIQIYSIGYMHEELHDPVHDPLAAGPGEPPVERPGRFPRFFTYMSLFCFSMLGLVLADNIFLVFVFWELVGLCSYLLIGFYYERASAYRAALKAFVTNRVGDFGMIVGLAILWTSLGTFQFSEIRQAVVEGKLSGPLLTMAGLAIFCGCVGKSAQFPLHVWLPDAMEGPTPVSALIHAATMVAAGVYLVGRFYFLFSPEALLVIAGVGAITLFLAGTIAVVQTDIKRVLAYSTISQLGYMMLGLGVGGWVAGLFHLLTHAFFKALLFLCSGSVIHATGTQEMPEMGGLFRKLPITAVTMLVGTLAICGIPLFSGYYSKDLILAHALLFWQQAPEGMGAALLRAVSFVVPVVGAGITSFYMFRMYFLTFLGRPRDQHVYEHAHESPLVMTVPLVVLAVLSWCAGYGLPGQPPLIEVALHQGPAAGVSLVEVPHRTHELAGSAGLLAVTVGIALAVLLYGLRVLSPEEVAAQFPRVYQFLWQKWYFDELYDRIFVRPVLRLAQACRQLDWVVIDGFVDGLARWTVRVSHWDGRFDFWVIDGLVNWLGEVTYRCGDRLRRLQTGLIRQYIVFLVVATIGTLAFLFYVTSLFAR
jgi:NADH-quinone oxidoreductase subunit L